MLKNTFKCPQHVLRSVVFDDLQENVTAPNRHKAVVAQKILLLLSDALKHVINTSN